MFFCLNWNSWDFQCFESREIGGLPWKGFIFSGSLARGADELIHRRSRHALGQCGYGSIAMSHHQKGGWTSINPSYFDVSINGVQGDLTHSHVSGWFLHLKYEAFSQLGTRRSTKASHFHQEIRWFGCAQFKETQSNALGMRSRQPQQNFPWKIFREPRTGTANIDNGVWMCLSTVFPLEIAVLKGFMCVFSEACCEAVCMFAVRGPCKISYCSGARGSVKCCNIWLAGLVDSVTFVISYYNMM